ncbi:MAG: 1-phosphofructokinase, partial [Lachnospiraceae bacterium]|nr:1-phosphofructokinase [Lachnospiraceae bacterium]
MIYTVTFNPSLDYIVKVDSFRYGELNRTTSETLFPGGKGINVSIVLNNLGYENTALGFLSGLTGDVLLELLKKRNVHQEFITVDEGMTRINVKMKTEKETEINGQGPEISHDDIERLHERLMQLQEGDTLVLAGNIPDVMPRSSYMDIMELLKDNKINFIVDATKDLLVNALKYHPFLIKPNHHELGEIFGIELKDKAEIAKYAIKLQEMGARNVIVSMSGDGAVMVTEDGDRFEAPSPKGKLVNSIGAGDSMVAGFLAGYMETHDYEKAFKMGLCTGSASAFSEELATKEDVAALLEKAEVHSII